MRFSIITPSFRNSDWLKLCLASVADQEGVDVEHIVQDAGSDDGTLNWLPNDPRVKAYIEKDEGMYDAINRGLRRSTGEIIAYLNSDEQYLPASLKSVAEFFAKNPDVDLVFGDAVVVDANGDYICYRKVLTPLQHHTRMCHLATLTCATFFRRRLIDEEKVFFDPQWRVIGDSQWMLHLLERKISMAVLRKFTSIFTDDGRNLSWGPRAIEEKKAAGRLAPAWARGFGPFFMMQHRLRRLFHGIYFQKPFRYALYTRKSPKVRVEHLVEKPTFLWRGRV